MKNIGTIIAISSVMLWSCSASSNLSDTEQKDTVKEVAQQGQVGVTSGINGKLSLVKPVKLGEPINIHFTVVNNLDTAASFCKWHTPFEPLMSKYLDVIAEDGTEADYQGAMAKRVMPPPADSYIRINSKDSSSVDFDLTKAYAIKKAGTYKIKYNSSAISGINIPDSLVIVVAN